jgi:hypothetical protein
MSGKKQPEGKMVYKSPSTGEHVAEHQYLAELMVKRHADKKGHVLTYKYWNNKDDFWAKEYRSQVGEAAKLLKRYSIRAIINALNVVKWPYSLRTHALLDEIKRQQVIIDKKVVSTEVKEISSDTTTFKGSFSRKGILGKDI